MCSARFEFLRRWVLPGTLLLAAPKCGLCLLAYAGLGTAVGLGGPELCGTTESATPVALFVAMTAVFTMTTIAAARLTRRPAVARP